MLRTDVDVSGVKKGTDNIKNAVKKTGQEFMNVGSTLSKALREGDAKTAQLANNFRKATLEAEKQAAKVDELKAYLSRLEVGEVTVKDSGAAKIQRDYEKVSASIEKTKAEIGELYVQLDQLQANAFKDPGGEIILSGAEQAEFDKMNAKLDELEPKLEADKKKAAELGEALRNAVGTATQAEIDKTKIKLSEAERKLGDLSVKAEIAGQKLQDGANGTGKSVSQVGKGLGRLSDLSENAEIAGQKLKTGAEGTQKAVAQIGEGLGRLGTRLTQLAASALIFSVVTAGFTALRKAIANVVMSDEGFVNSLNQLRAALWTAFAPIINYVVPVLKTLVNWITAAIVTIARFIAVLTGKSYSAMVDNGKKLQQQASAYKAVGSGGAKAAKGMKKATEEAKKQLAAFDDLNILTEDKASADSGDAGGGGGGAGGVPGADFDGIKDYDENNIPWLTKALDDLSRALIGIKDIDLTNLSNSLKVLGVSIKKLAGIAWKIILWGIENVIVPLTKFVVEETLPRFLETLANAVDLLRVVLDKGFEILKQFYGEFLKPIAEYTAPKFLEVWDNINLKISEFVKLVDESEAWEDLQTILGLIYDRLSPVVKLMADFVSWVAKFAINKAFTELEWIFRDLEDALGLVAALIRGDFDDAWEHLKDLMIDNKVDRAKEQIENLKTSFNELKAKVGEIVEDWKSKIDDMVNSWKEKISAWWNKDVAPWFTAEKWDELFIQIGKSLAWAVVGTSGFIETWKTNISAWWNKDVAPWFTAKRWQELFKTIADGILYQFTDENGFLKTWGRNITTWWNDYVTPWFSLKKWIELGENIKNGIAAGIKGGMNSVIGFLNSVISGFQSMVNGVIRGINKVIDGYNLVAKEVPGIKTIDHLKTIDLSGFKIPALAKGGIVPYATLAEIGERGKEAVLPLENNTEWMDMLADRIAARNGGSGNTTVVLEVDGREFGRAVVEQGGKESRRIGTRLVIA